MILLMTYLLAAPPVVLDSSPGLVIAERGISVRLPKGSRAVPKDAGWIVAPVATTGGNPALVVVTAHQTIDKAGLLAALKADPAIKGAPVVPVEKGIWFIAATLPYGDAPAPMVATLSPHGGGLFLIGMGDVNAQAELKQALLAMARAASYGKAPTTKHEMQEGLATARFEIEPRYTVEGENPVNLSAPNEKIAIMLGDGTTTPPPPTKDLDAPPFARKGRIWVRVGTVQGIPAAELALVASAGTLHALALGAGAEAAARALLEGATLEKAKESARTAALRALVTGHPVDYVYSASHSELFQVCADGTFNSRSSSSNSMIDRSYGQVSTLYMGRSGQAAGRWRVLEEDGRPTLEFDAQDTVTKFVAADFIRLGDFRTDTQLFRKERAATKVDTGHIVVDARPALCP